MDARSSRVLLQLIVPPYSGSTALLTLLMSSPQVPASQPQIVVRTLQLLCIWTEVLRLSLVWALTPAVF